MKPWIPYLVVGVVLAVVCDWRLKESSRRERITNAILSVCAWPLFTPLVLLPLLVPRARRESEASIRIKRALAEARAAVVNTPLANLLPEVMLSRLGLALGHIEERRAELTELLARPDFQCSPDGPRTEQPESVARLWAILERDRAVLHDMAELAEALRAQLLWARYSGQTAQGATGTGLGGDVRELAVELSARIESLDAWFELDSPHSRVAARAAATDTPTPS